MGFSTGKKILVTKRNMRSGSGALSTWGTNLTKRNMRSGSGALSTWGTNLETTRDLGSRSQVFGHVQNPSPRPFSCVLLARSLPINKNQRATVFHLIFAFLSCLIVKAPKNFLRHVYTCCYHLLQNQAHKNAQRPLWSLLY